MLKKQFLLSWLATFTAMMLYGFVVYSFILDDFFADHLGDIVYRPAGTEKMEWLVLANVLMAYVMVRMFAHGYEDKGLGEAVRFGVLMGVFWSSIEMFNYAFMPGTFTAMWLGFLTNIVLFVFASIVLAKVYKLTGDDG